MPLFFYFTTAGSFFQPFLESRSPKKKKVYIFRTVEEGKEREKKKQPAEEEKVYILPSPPRVEKRKSRPSKARQGRQDTWLNPQGNATKQPECGAEQKRKQHNITQELSDVKPHAPQVIDAEAVEKIIKSTAEKPHVDKR